MLIYKIYHFIIFEIIFLLISLLTDKKLKKILFFILLLMFSFYIGYRNEEIGIDTKAYINEYLTGTGGYFSEKGFTFIGKVLYNFSFNWNDYFFILSLISSSLYYLGFKYIDKNNSFLLFWIFMFNVTGLYGQVNGIRQFIAGGFLLFSISLLKNKRNIYSYILFFIGCLFHKSLIIFLFIYIKLFFQLYKKLNIKYKFLIIFIFIYLSFVLDKFLLLNSQIVDYSLKEFSKSFYIKYLFLLIIFFYYIYKSNKTKNTVIEYIFFYNLLIIELFFNFQHLSNRFIYYINIFTPILFYEIFNKNKKIMIFIIFLYHILILYYPSTRNMFKF